MSAAERQAPDRNLAMEFVRVTEVAALAAARWMGRGEKEKADGAATEAMRVHLRSVACDGIIVIGEGEKDEAPMLFNGEQVGDGTPPEIDIAVDPLEGTTLCALGRPNALAVIAVSDRGTMYDPPGFYMEKIAVGPEAVGSIDLDKSPTENLRAVAKATGKSIHDLTAVVLDRPRHDDLIAEIREAGARIRLIQDGDVAGAISTGMPEAGADILFGVGGTPEGVISAAAIKCLGGEMLGRLAPQKEGELEAIKEAGREADLERILNQDDLVKGNNCFFAATGVTTGELLRGVNYDRRGATTQSLVMRSKSGTVRTVSARHSLEKLRDFSAIDFD
ncbi:MAG: class II fructose-bisphosphatase [Actinomycetota bacterium]|nr:class II fructose-bisphosphatase [Actinomycetota bacterium]